MKSHLNKLLLLSLLILAGCEHRNAELLIEGSAQGTSYHIKIVPTERPVDVDALHKQVEDLLQDIDQKLSNYRDDSEISIFNQRKTVEWQKVSPEIVELVEIAGQVYERTQGCYDLTIKPLFDLWGFSKHENRIPSQDEIKSALAHVGMFRLETSMSQSSMRKLDPEVQIDLSSIAQGYTVGALAKSLEAQGVRNYLVEVGGEMKVKGRNGKGNAWRVAIEKPSPFTREVQKVLDIHQEKGTAIMTAGTYRNFFENKGQTYSHIINPVTGSPVTHNLLSVTVLHDDPTWADAWDTALLCVGETEAAEIAEVEQLKVLLIYQQDNELKEYMSKAFTNELERQ
ncbi:MAG: FAD:protein FMN transferase [Methylomonas sp.]|jgi:thiamine biosynthesis lipoprotein